MSAAEKLKALESSLKTDDIEEWEGAMINLAEAMADALPQIVAVIEAAEEFVAKVERQEARSVRSYGAFSAALAALEQQLGEVGSATEPEAPTPQ